MKRMLLSAISCLLLGTAMASNVLVLHLKDGSSQSYVLLTDEPRISVVGDNIVVTTNTTESSYAMTDVSYFNYDFNKARRFCTDDSEKWLQFAASNVQQEDVDLLRQQEEPATVDVDEWDYTSDSTASVHVNVHNYLRMDSIGKAGRMTDEGQYVLNAVIHQGKWFIRMANLPRSEKRSHD